MARTPCKHTFLTRRALVSVLGASAAGILSGCTRSSNPGSGLGSIERSSPIAGSSPRADATAIAWSRLIVENSSAPDGKLAEDSILGGWGATCTGAAVESDTIYVAAASTLLAFDTRTGAERFRIELSGEGAEDMGNACGLAVSDGICLIALDTGWLVRCDVSGTPLVRWRMRMIDRMAFQGQERTFSNGENFPPEVKDTDPVPAVWSCTDLIIRDDSVCLGLTCYQLEEASHLFCVSKADGALRWHRLIPGYLANAGNLGYPAQLGDCYIVPDPTRDGIVVLDAGTGEERDHIETDGPLRMGFTSLRRQGYEALCTQATSGEIHLLSESGGGISVDRLALPQAGENVVASGARPVIAGDTLISQMPTELPSERLIADDHDASSGAAAFIDLESLSLVEARDGRELESTPAVYGNALYYVGRSGLYRAPLDFAGAGDFTLVDQRISKMSGEWDQLLIQTSGMLFAISGNTSRKRLYAIRLQDPDA